MRKLLYFAPLIIALFGFGASSAPDDCAKDPADARGKIKPWEKGAWEPENTAMFSALCI